MTCTNTKGSKSNIEWTKKLNGKLNGKKKRLFRREKEKDAQRQGLELQ